MIKILCMAFASIYSFQSNLNEKMKVIKPFEGFYNLSEASPKEYIALGEPHNKPLVLKYTFPATDSEKGWESESLPIGNGWFGANIFGIPERERIQITENSLQNPGNMGGLNNFAEIYIYFDHRYVSNYSRSLSLDDGMAWCHYNHAGVEYTREYFASYPDRVLVIRLEASKPGTLSFKVAPEIPFIKDYAIKPGDEGGKEGTVTAEGNIIVMKGKMNYYSILFEGQLQVINEGGTISADESWISVKDANSAVLLFTAATNYKLTPEVFLESDPKKKLQNVDPGQHVSSIIGKAASMGYETLRRRHLEDYQKLFGRVSFNIEGDYPDMPTDEMLKAYKNGETNCYLETLFFQYGRYLLISSSRPGTLPANLQGIWNCYDQSPWGSGYWHNINVQMNYWLAFNTGLAETFEAYIDFNKAFRQKAEAFATDYIRSHNPENFDEHSGACGWTIGTASYPYAISAPGGHSGPGTGGLTTKLFWDYYDFTRDTDILRNVTYPALLGMSRFLTKTVRPYDGRLLVSFSASPEQMRNGPYISGGNYYQTIGCAFDQQMLYENGHDLLAAADLLGENDPVVSIQKQQLPYYYPVNIGWSGQVKEYLEERFYGEIGEYRHRHISQLAGLFPGTIINRSTPAWLDAARVTLNERGDGTTGWSMAHRINAWARIGDGDRAYKIFNLLLSTRTLPNLWCTHPPFQIDGNLGGAAGIAEMLLQSHEGYVYVLPALPSSWKNGNYSGLIARGAFVVSAEWKNGVATEIIVESLKGGLLRLYTNGISTASVTDFAGVPVNVVREKTGIISFKTAAGESYRITGMHDEERMKAPEEIVITGPGLTLKWKGKEGASFKIYRSVEGAPEYEHVATLKNKFTWRDRRIKPENYEIITYKVTSCKSDGSGESITGPAVTFNHATELERARQQMRDKSK